MDTFFHYNSTRAKKARLNRRLSGRYTNAGILFLIALSAVCAIFIYWYGNYKIAALAAALSAAMTLVVVWNIRELSELKGRIPKGNELEIDQALDAQALARLPKRPTMDDLFKSIQGHWRQRFIADRFGLTPDIISGLATQNTSLENTNLWETALGLCQKHNRSEISIDVIYVSFILSHPEGEAFIKQMELDTEDLDAGLKWVHHVERTIKRSRKKRFLGGIARDWTFGYTPLLSQYAYNVSQDIQSYGFIHQDTQTHRQTIEQIMKVLDNISKPNIALVGDVGVGKSTAVHSFAQRLLADNAVPHTLKYQQVVSLNAATIIANAGGGTESLVIRLLNEAIRARNIILFLDEAHLFFTSGREGAVDIRNVLLPVLQNGSLRLIMSFTTKQWNELARNDESLDSLINKVVVLPAEETDTMRIMQDHALLFEHRHKVIFTYQAFKEAYRLSDRYIHNQAFPGKAIKVMEISIPHAYGNTVLPQSVQAAIEQSQGVKVARAGQEERTRLLNLERLLHERLINQERAVKVLADALRRARSGVHSQDKPIGTFLFLGPTGVGKTELSKTLAAVYFGGPGHMIRVDMNEYNSSDSTARLLQAGSKAGGSLMEQIRRQPYSVVLLDEIEKAHSDVQNLLLQMLDEGRLTDDEQRDVSFKDAIIIATSNAGAEEIRNRIDAGESLDAFEEPFINQLIDQLVFRPEFLNRFDEIVLFRPLSQKELLGVVDLLLDEVNVVLDQQKIKIELNERAKQWLVKQGFDPRLGARPLRRTVQRTVQNVVAKKLLEGNISAGSRVRLDVADLEAEDDSR